MFFEFDDKDAGEFSTHRKDIQALDIDDDVTTWGESDLRQYP